MLGRESFKINRPEDGIFQDVLQRVRSIETDGLLQNCGRAAIIEHACTEAKYSAALMIERIGEGDTRRQVSVAVEVRLKFVPDAGEERGAGELFFHLQKPGVVVLLGSNESITGVERVEKRLACFVGR